MISFQLVPETVFSIIVCFVFTLMMLYNNKDSSIGFDAWVAVCMALIGCSAFITISISVVLGAVLAFTFFAGLSVIRLFNIDKEGTCESLDKDIASKRSLGMVLSIISLALLVVSKLPFADIDITENINFSLVLLYAAPVFSIIGATLLIEKLKKDSTLETIGFTMFAVQLYLTIAGILPIITGNYLTVALYADPIISIMFFAIGILGLAMYAPTKTSTNAFGVIALGLIIVSTISYILFLDYSKLVIFSNFSIIGYMFVCVGFDVVAFILLLISKSIAKKKSTISVE